MARLRADQLVVDRGLAASRSQARALILAGEVLTDADQLVSKPGDLLPEDAEVRLRSAPPPFVSRGGVKLAAALDAFQVDVRDRVCLDVGASTGGFTDCLLQRGARRVYAADVGYGQLAWSLRQDPRVVVIERTNIREMSAERVPEPCTGIVIDVSFISLKLVIPEALRFAAPECVLVALVKPQFEVGRAGVGKGGIVRDEALRQKALEDIGACCAALGLHVFGTMASPILGAKGNKEFLLAARR